MSTIAEKLTKLATYKSDIKAAIISKGQTVDDDMSKYAAAIEQISVGSDETVTETPHTFNGTEYFDTGIKTPDHANYTYEVKFKVSENNKHIFGLRKTSNTNHISIVQGTFQSMYKCIMCRYADSTNNNTIYMCFGLNGVENNASIFIKDCYEAGDIVTVKLNKDKAVLVNHTKNTQYEITNTGNTEFTLPDDSFYLGAVNTGGTPSSDTDKFDSDIYYLAFIKNNFTEHYLTWNNSDVLKDYMFMNISKQELVEKIAGKDEIYNSMVNEKDTIINDKNIEIETLKAQLGGSTEEEYDPELDEYTHIFFTPTSRTTEYSFQINPTGTTTIYWGDGKSDTIYNPGIQFVKHMYDAFVSPDNKYNYGTGTINYTQAEIKIYSEKPYQIEGRGASSGTTLTSTNYRGMNNIANLITEIIPANNCTFGDYALYGCSSLTNIKLSDLQTTFNNYMLNNCYVLKHIKFNNVTSIGNYVFGNDYSLENIKLDGITTIGMSSFQSCYSLKQILIPDNVTTINSNAFAGSGINGNGIKKVIWNSPQMFIQTSTFNTCYNLEVLDLRSATKIMRLGTSETATGTFTNTAICPYSGKLKILVPKNLYNDWKKSTYWINFWHYLYWVDDEGNYRNDAV